MPNGRGLAVLGCVVALAVMAGIIGAAIVIGGALTTTAAPRVASATPTPGYVESMKPIHGTVASPGYAMTADEHGGASFFLAAGTAVQIIRVSGSLGQVQVMDGQHKNRVGWVPVNAVTT